MIVKVCFFTEKGKDLALKRLAKADSLDLIPIYRDKDDDLGKWTEDAFNKRLPIIFIGACGIAVRSIAPFIKDKLTDSPVIVIDDKGEFVIPVLSGHIGGANELAENIAQAIGASAVITTSTDKNDRFAVDLFAKKNRLYIVNRDGIAKVSAKALRGETLKVAAYEEDYVKIQSEPGNTKFEMVTYGMSDADISIGDDKYPKKTLVELRPKKVAIGIGCKRGKTFEELKTFVEEMCVKSQINISKDVFAIASIDIKKNEIGLMELAQFYNVAFMVFTSEELANAHMKYEVNDDCGFSESEFVKKITGVSNVCERAAMCAAEGGKLLVKKTAHDGMTFSAAQVIQHKGEMNLTGE